MDYTYPSSKQEFLARLDTLKVLEETEFETYTLAKNRETGQHFLRYSMQHINLSEGARRDDYEHLLAVESDEVLGLLFGEQPYSFPDHWKRTYLRSGTDDRLMPFDPSENHDLDEDAKTERALLAKLLQYKQEWQQTDDKGQLTKQFFKKLDDLMKKEED